MNWLTTIIKTSILVVVITFSSNAKAQVTTFQFWSDYDHSYNFSEKWKMINDYGFRWQNYEKLEDWWRLHARFSFAYNGGDKVDYLGGLGLFFTQNQVRTNTLEIRPWQGMSIKGPNFGRFYFSHLVRFEERILLGIEEGASTFNIKFRYKLALKIPINNSVLEAGTIYALTSAEAFFDLVSPKAEFNNDRFRFEAGFGYKVNSKTTIRALYTLQQVFNNQLIGIHFSEGFRQIDNVFRLTVSQRFGFEK